MKQTFFLSTDINFLDLRECHLLAFYGTRNININNNKYDRTLYSMIYVQTHGSKGYHEFLFENHVSIFKTILKLCFFY